MTEKPNTVTGRLREVAQLAALAADRWPRGDHDGFDGAFEAIGYAEDNLHEIEAVITDGIGFDRTTTADEPRLHRSDCAKGRCARDCPARHEPAVLADRLDRLADESDSHSDDDALRAAARALRATS